MDDRVFPCVQAGCSASFSTRNLLHVHIQNHKQGKNYCLPCDKFYVGNKHLATATHKEKQEIAAKMKGII